MLRHLLGIAVMLAFLAGCQVSGKRWHLADSEPGALSRLEASSGDDSTIVDSMFEGIVSFLFEGLFSLIFAPWGG